MSWLEEFEEMEWAAEWGILKVEGQYVYAGGSGCLGWFLGCWLGGEVGNGMLGVWVWIG